MVVSKVAKRNLAFFSLKFFDKFYISELFELKLEYLFFYSHKCSNNSNCYYCSNANIFIALMYFFNLFHLFSLLLHANEVIFIISSCIFDAIITDKII